LIKNGIEEFIINEKEELKIPRKVYIILGITDLMAEII
jgi:hypothetical protein